MKKNYEKPEIEAIELEVEDIIQTSGMESFGTVDEVLGDNIGGTTETTKNLNDWL